jgi:hypothetical protein
VAHQNVRAFNVARELFQPGDSPGDMAHSGDWGQYGFLQLGDYASARDRIRLFEELAAANNNQRLTGVVTLTKARYVIETEEWKVEPVADSASNETVFANGVSAVRTADMATAEKMLGLLAAKAQAAPGGAPAAGGAHADHGPAPAAPAAGMGGGPDAGKSVRIMHKELSALVAEAKGQKDQAIATLKEAVQIEESMRPPNGAADPIKPSHELLGEVLLRAGRPAEAAAMFDTTLLRTPNRARALHGSAVAHMGAGNRATAAERWTMLQSFWKGRPFNNPTNDAR